MAALELDALVSRHLGELGVADDGEMVAGRRKRYRRRSKTNGRRRGGAAR